MSNITIQQGDNLQLLKNIPDNSIDSVVTDAPYGLGKEPDPVKLIEAWAKFGYLEIKGKGFMGKEWDAFVPQPIFWKEVFRVLKPGGHVLCFFGTRTYDWGTLALRIAGFEIRDMITWHYGSGFPKSLDVSKAIDKMGPAGQTPFAEFSRHYEEQRKSLGLSHAKICEHGGWYGNVNHGGSSVNWANGYSMPTREQWKVLQPLLNLDQKWAAGVEREQYRRDVIGNRVGSEFDYSPGQANERNTKNIEVTIPSCADAQEWDGYGTALKPATEPICLARKPLIGTVAQNILEHGTGGINIDGCRIEFESEEDKSGAVFGRGTDILGGNYVGAKHSTGQTDIQPNDKGRFPANLILDEYAACLLDDQSGTLTSGKPSGTRQAGNNVYGQYATGQEVTGFGDSGGASRFFYCAKASQFERNAGLEKLTAKRVGDERKVTNDTAFQRDALERLNTHPTVKPISLMRWLIRLITPKGGTCLDTFGGSGTTACAAAFEDVDIIIMEMEQEYIPIIEARTAYWRKVANREKYIQELKNSVQTLF